MIRRNVRVDAEGNLRCWNCGGKNFLNKRTAAAKVAVGVGALLTRKKLKCQQCGQYNLPGRAQPYDGPASRKYRKMNEKLQGSAQGPAMPLPAMAPPPQGPPPGWYPDPNGQPVQRWWDGYQWTEHVQGPDQ